MNRKLSILTLLTILIFSGFIYFYRLNQIPSGFYVDEATVAYNSYSILKTGRDIFGQPYPILFRLLGSYTPPLFIYTSIPFISFFGTEPFVFRSISAISALISIVFFFLLIKKLNIFESPVTLYLATFFYAISPWLIFNARLGYEVTLAYLLFNIGIFFLYAAFIKPKYLIWGAFFLSLSTYAAHTQRYLVGIYITLYLILFGKKIFKKVNLKFLKLSFCIILLTQIPNFLVINTAAFWVKNQRLFEQPVRQITSNIIQQTFTYLSPKNLFYDLPDIDLQHTVPEISVMYNFLVIPFFIGIYLLFNSIKKTSHKPASPAGRFLALLFFVTLIPAVFSGQFISIQRALPFLLPLSIVIGLGIDYLWQKLKPMYAFPIFILFSIYSLVLLYRSYFVLFPKERANAWNFGYSQLIDFIKQSTAPNFMVDNTRNPRNYILLLYYLRYPPSNFQKEVNPVYKIDYYRSLPPENNYKFSNIEMRSIDWGLDSCKEQIIIGDELSVSDVQAQDHKLTKVYELKDYRGRIIFKGFKTNPERNCK